MDSKIKDELGSKSVKQAWIFVFILLAVAVVVFFVVDEAEPKPRSVSIEDGVLMSSTGSVLLKTEDLPDEISVTQDSSFSVDGEITGAILSPDRSWVAISTREVTHDIGWLLEVDGRNLYPVAFQYGGEVFVGGWSLNSQYFDFAISNPVPQQRIKIIDRENINDFVSETGIDIVMEGEVDMQPEFVVYERGAWQNDEFCLVFRESEHCLTIEEIASMR